MRCQRFGTWPRLHRVRPSAAALGVFFVVTATSVIPPALAIRSVAPGSPSPSPTGSPLSGSPLPEASPASTVRRARPTATLTPRALRIIGSTVAHERSPFNTSPAALKVFPREAYRDQGQARLSSVLDQTPGALALGSSSLNRAAPLGDVAPLVRSGLSFETAPLLDGDPLTLPSSGSFDLNDIPSFVLQDVEIVKGPGATETTLSHAIEGVVNLRTAEPGLTPKALLELEADSHGDQFSDLAYGGTAPNGRFSFATMFSIDGSSNRTAPLAGEGLQRAQLLKGRYDLSAMTTVTATYLGTQSALGLAGAQGFAVPSLIASFLPAPGAPSGSGPPIDSSSAADVASFAGSPGAREQRNFDVYSLDIRATPPGGSFIARAYGFDLRRSDEDAQAPGSTDAGLDSVRGALLEYDRTATNHRYEFALSQRSGSATAQLCEQFCAATIPAGSRTDDTTLRAAAALHIGDAADVALSDAFLLLGRRATPDGGLHWDTRTFATDVVHAGASYRLRPQVSLRAALGSGVAPPSLAMLDANPRAIRYAPYGLPSYLAVQSTVPLDLETSFSYDLGLEYRLHGETTTFSSDVYRTVTHGAFVDGSSAVAPDLRAYRWFNLGAMTSEGLEFALQQFKPVGLGYIVAGDLARDYVDPSAVSPALYREFGRPANLATLPLQNIGGGGVGEPGANDVAAVRVPYARGYGEISYKWPRGSRLSLGALYWGANNPYAVPAFAELNANLELSLGSRSKLQLSAQNLTNLLGDSLPLGFSGIPVPLHAGGLGATNAGMLGPRTVRFMFRESIGPGGLLER